MCGRFDQHTPRPVIARRWFGLSLPEQERLGRYNTAPSMEITTIRSTGEGVPFEFAKWGYRPKWANDDAPTPINARSEKVATSKFFQDGFRHRRCLIPANGWFEWMQAEYGKQPYYITQQDAGEEDVVFFSGIWEGSPDRGFCTAILTEPAAPNLSHIHSRQPVVLDPGCRYDWLDPSLTERDQVKQVAKRFDPAKLVSWPVSPKMNRPDNDGPGVIEPLG